MKPVQSIVLAICEQQGVSPEDFFGPGRTQELAFVRSVAIKVLKQAGFNDRAIARLIRRNISTVQYWLHPEYREHRRGNYRRAWLKKRGANPMEPSHENP